MKYCVVHLVCLLSWLLLVGCASKSNPEWSQARSEMEEDACLRLDKARAAIEAKDYALAKSILMEMRKKDSLAITAREVGIVLMDSVNLLEAEQEMQALGREMLSASDGIDSLQLLWNEAQRKARFYQRKLEHDKQIQHAD